MLFNSLLPIVRKMGVDGYLHWIEGNKVVRPDKKVIVDGKVYTSLIMRTYNVYVHLNQIPRQK